MCCNGSNVKKNGHRCGFQMYYCRDCDEQFQGEKRIRDITLWNEYLTDRRTVSEPAVIHKCSERTIRRHLALAADNFNSVCPESAVIITDTTYFSRSFGVMLFMDAESGKILHRKYVRNETNRDYLDGLNHIEEFGTEIKSVVCDGHTGLLQAINSCPAQMCQFHQLQIIRRLLTKDPHLSAGIELLKLVQSMFPMKKNEFISLFNKWCEDWEDFLNERTVLLSGKATYIHRRLRTARRSIRTHLKWLFTYEEHPELNIPNTTNRLEGFNTHIKKALLNHNGLNDINKKKFIDGLLNTKK
ncbi:IS256 family transposase, variant Zn-binding type [Prevotella dentasini]|uniref:IS256 family transposase, variant Zn-binding type n=1 Tax=Prevotella dentasini TaxID=589537 RepID=UPI004032DCAD